LMRKDDSARIVATAARSGHVITNEDDRRWSGGRNHLNPRIDSNALVG